MENSEKLTFMSWSYLTLNTPITTAADDIHKHFLHCFLEKIRLDVSVNQALFSSKDKSKKIKCRLLQFSFGALKIYPLVGNIKMIW